MTTPPALVGWAADCAERALQRLGVDDDRAVAAVTAARAFAAGTGSADAVRDAALAAQFAARDSADAGYLAVATAVRAAATAAASVDDPALAIEAARLAIEGLVVNSAVCEARPTGDAERRWQWDALPADLRTQVFGAEPPEAGPVSCNI